MNYSIFNNGYDGLQTDFNNDNTSAAASIEGRTEDLFPEGGVVGSSSGAVTANVANPATQVDIAGGIIYDSLGRRVVFATVPGVALVATVGQPNYIVASIVTTTTTPVAHPISGALNNTRSVDSVAIVALTAFTQGQLDGLGNPYVLLATVVSNGTVETIADVRNIINVNGLLFYGGMAGGTANAIALTIAGYLPNQNIVSGTTILFEPSAPNTGSTTVSVNGGTPINLLSPNGSPLINDEIQGGTLFAIAYIAGSYRIVGSDLAEVYINITSLFTSVGTLTANVATLNVEVPTLQGQVSTLDTYVSPTTPLATTAQSVGPAINELLSDIEAIQTFAHITSFGNPDLGGVAGPQSWIVPAGIFSIRAQLWGAGGCGSTTEGVGGGGGYVEGIYSVTPGQVIDFTIGAGGVNGNGGNTYITAFGATAYGGGSTSHGICSGGGGVGPFIVQGGGGYSNGTFALAGGTYQGAPSLGGDTGVGANGYWPGGGGTNGGSGNNGASGGIIFSY